MKRKSWLVIGLAGAMALAACGSQASSDMSYMGIESDDYYMETTNGVSYDGFASMSQGSYMSAADSLKEGYTADTDFYETELPEAGSGFESAASEYNFESEKLIRTVKMRLQTKEFDTLLAYLEERVAEIGGYVQDSRIYGNAMDSYGYRSAELTYRIPQNNLDDFIMGVGEKAVVVYKTENAENVTLQYADTESRLKALEIEQERFLALLEKADDVDSIITIEKHLTELRYEIEAYASTLRVYDNQVNYSTVTLSVSEVNRIVSVEENPTLLTRMKDGFVATWYDLQDGAANFMVWLVTNALYLIIWAVIIVILIVVLKKLIKGKKKAGKDNGTDKTQEMLVNTEEEEHDRMDFEK